ncbi:hypothetical protein V8C35DRAFT_327296 [Trichoderma chlorosporum]
MSAEKFRCAHFCPCPCPLLPEYAQRPLKRDELSPAWGVGRANEEDPNKVIAEIIKRQRLRYMLRNMTVTFTNIFSKTKRSPEKAPKVRSFRWLMSSHHVAEGYQDRPPPWRMLVRTYFKDLPKQLREKHNPSSVKYWRKLPWLYSNVKDCPIELTYACPEITCGRRDVISQCHGDKNRSLSGDWLIVVNLWATDRRWIENVDLKDLISFSSVIGIRAWEWVDALDATTKTPYLFYELERGKDGVLKDTVFGGNAYKDYDPVPMEPGDPVPTRLSGLRRLMNGKARRILYASYEF